jgi:hypothetical protein
MFFTQNLFTMAFLFALCLIQIYCSLVTVDSPKLRKSPQKRFMLCAFKNSVKNKEACEINKKYGHYLAKSIKRLTETEKAMIREFNQCCCCEETLQEDHPGNKGISFGVCIENAPEHQVDIPSKDVHYELESSLSQSCTRYNIYDYRPRQDIDENQEIERIMTNFDFKLARYCDNCSKYVLAKSDNTDSNRICAEFLHENVEIFNDEEDEEYKMRRRREIVQWLMICIAVPAMAMILYSLVF